MAGEPFPATSFKRHPVRAIQHDHAPPVWLGGWRASCSPLNGALVGAVRGGIRNAVNHTPDLASGANGAEHRVVS